MIDETWKFVFPFQDSDESTSVTDEEEQPKKKKQATGRRVTRGAKTAEK